MWAVENRRLTSQISITWTFESDLAAWMNSRKSEIGQVAMEANLDFYLKIIGSNFAAVQCYRGKDL